MPSPFDLQPGERPFPGYVLHLPLGRGAGGEVWEAVGPDGSTVALKFVRCKNSTVATKEVRSCQALSGLHHPHLLRVFQVFLQADYVVISMEPADGSLLDLFDTHAAQYGTALEPELVCRYISEAATALDYLNTFHHQHEGRRVAFQHCDIKPSNLLLFRGQVKVGDFGLATPIATALVPHDRAGTPDYAAPEVYRGRVSDQTDQYALAVSYCQLRGGRLPFHNIMGRFTPSYSRGQPDLSMLSPPERPIIARALAVAPVNRWSSCGELAARLRELFALPAPSPSWPGFRPRPASAVK